MTWSCAAIDHGVTIFPNGKIGPCCQVSFDYLKPISEITNPNRFADLKTQQPPTACSVCINNEQQNITSYRKLFNQQATTADGFQFVDLRNTNSCNLKCRFCGPHFSDKWGPTLHTAISAYNDLLFTDSLHWLYFTGGEPFINPEHWSILEQLINQGQAGNIALLYNTNLTTLKYKDKNVIDLWKQFKAVTVNCSLEAVGSPLEYIRSGTNWDKIYNNLLELKKQTQVSISLAATLGVLNIWFIKDLFELAQNLNIPTNITILTGPSYLALDVLPDELKPLALEKLEEVKSYLPDAVYHKCHAMIKNGMNQWLFPRTLNQILILDNLNNEHLFDLLPFKKYTERIVAENFQHE